MALPQSKWGLLVETNFADMPIVLDTNPHTKRLDGDDSGYRMIPTSPLDIENPDPLVVVNGIVRTHPVYAIGKTKGVCPYYGNGLGAPPQVLVRKPVLEKLIQVDPILEPYGLQAVIYDGFRLGTTQRDLWRYLRKQIMRNEGLVEGRLSFYDEIRVGIQADDIGSYCEVEKNDEFYASVHNLLNGRDQDLIVSVASRLKISPQEVAELYHTFNANLGRNGLNLDRNAPTAHGSGGAVDVGIIHQSTGFPCNFGAPFDFLSASKVTQMDYFDSPESSPAEYEWIVRRSPELTQYLYEVGYENRIARAFYSAQRMRRILFHTMMSLGASFYAGEFWHFQFGNELGGNQASGELYGSGNACHAILNGKKEAVWGNAAAHALARKVPGFYGSI